MTDIQHEALIGTLMSNMNTQTRAHAPKDGSPAVSTPKNHA